MDYEVVRMIWWAVLGVLLIGFAVTDGFDFGVAALLPFVAKNNNEKRIVINTIGPVWDGNQVWFILFGASIFGAFPYIYSAAFSLFYIAIFLLLSCFVIRPIAIDFRSKMSASWAKFWDNMLCFSGTLGSILFGIVVGNCMVGLKFDFDELNIVQNYTSFFSLFNPFSLLCGLIGYVLLVSHGAAYLALKTDEEVKKRASFILNFTPILLIILLSIGAFYAYNLQGFSFNTNVQLDRQDLSIPFNQQVVLIKHGLFANYYNYKWFLIAPIGFYISAILVIIFKIIKKDAFLFASHSFMVTCVVLLFGFSTFPFLLPSTANLNASLTIFNSSSSEVTLKIMLGIICVFLPIILSYIIYVYYSFRGRITKDIIEKNPKSLY